MQLRGDRGVGVVGKGELLAGRHHVDALLQQRLKLSRHRLQAGPGGVDRQRGRRVVREPVPGADDGSAERRAAAHFADVAPVQRGIDVDAGDKLEAGAAGGQTGDAAADRPAPELHDPDRGYHRAKL